MEMGIGIHHGGTEAPGSHGPVRVQAGAGRFQVNLRCRPGVRVGIHSERTIVMRRLMIVIVLVSLTGFGLWAQDSGQPAAAPTQDAVQLRQQIDELKQTVAAMEKRLDAQEKAQPAAVQGQKKEEPNADLQAEVKDLNERVSTAERKGLLDRLAWSGDYRFEAHTITGNIPAHFDGMMMQNLVVRTLFYAQ